MADKKEFMTYKGKPLVRCGNELYYGSMDEPYVIHLVVKSTKDVNGLKVADKVAVQLMATDPDLSPRKVCSSGVVRRKKSQIGRAHV